MLKKDTKTIIENIKNRISTGEGITKHLRNIKNERSDSESDEISDIENEPQKEYCLGGYHKVTIGEIYHGRYTIVSKLGWGYFSTVWLCWDKTNEIFVAL